MRSITAIYELYKIPESLQLHMLRAAAIAKQIVDNWVGPEINGDFILKVLLLHDMGNIVKFSDDDLTQEQIELRQEIVNKYGHDDHVISNQIAKELGLNQEELDMMDAKIFIKNDLTVNLDSYEIKIGAYADQRVAPDGIYSIRERLEEAKSRYKDKPGSSMNNSRTDLLMECAYEIEKQVMMHCNIMSEDINNESVQGVVEDLKGYEV